MEGVFFLLAQLAESQHGLATLDQLQELGISRRMVDRLLATGQLVRVAPRVFLVHGAPPTWQRRVLAECLSAGPDAIVSHRSAAALYALDGFDQLRLVHLSVPRHRQPGKRRDVRVHRSPDYELIRPTVRQRVPVTDPARLVLDLYATEPNRDVARRGLFSVQEEARQLDRPVRVPGGARPPRPAWDRLLPCRCRAVLPDRLSGDDVRGCHPGVAAEGRTAGASTPVLGDGGWAAFSSGRGLPRREIGDRGPQQARTLHRRGVRGGSGAGRRPRHRGVADHPCGVGPAPGRLRRCGAPGGAGAQ